MVSPQDSIDTPKFKILKNTLHLAFTRPYARYVILHKKRKLFIHSEIVGQEKGSHSRTEKNRS